METYCELCGMHHAPEVRHDRTDEVTVMRGLQCGETPYGRCHLRAGHPAYHADINGDPLGQAAAAIKYAEWRDNI